MGRVVPRDIAVDNKARCARTLQEVGSRPRGTRKRGWGTRVRESRGTRVRESRGTLPLPPSCPTLRGFRTERARLGTFRGFGTERARLGTFRGFGTERARLGPLEAWAQI